MISPAAKRAAVDPQPLRVTAHPGLAKPQRAANYSRMPRRVDAGRLDITGRWDADWVPRPNKDIDYYSDLSAEADRIKHKLDRIDARPGQPFRRAEWPTRQPKLYQAQVGDVLAGNIELRATCKCGHSAVVDRSVLGAKFDPRTRIIDIRRKVRCTQCQRYGGLSMSYPDTGG